VRALRDLGDGWRAVGGVGVISGVVAAPPRVVSAALTSRAMFGLGDGHVAPGDEIPLLGGWFRVVSVTVAGWSAVAVRGRSRRISVALTAGADGTVVTCPAELLAGIRSTALALADAPVVVGTAIVRGPALLAQQRAYPPAVAGLWELPGGRVEPGESDADAVVRECHEELGIEVAVGAALGPDVALPRGKLLRIYRASLVDPDAVPHPHDHADLRWLKAGQLGSVKWLPADRVLLPSLRQTLRTPACPTLQPRVSTPHDR
jgi:8-oxo-dGTP diphosphatase